MAGPFQICFLRACEMGVQEGSSQPLYLLSPSEYILFILSLCSLFEHHGFSQKLCPISERLILSNHIFSEYQHKGLQEGPQGIALHLSPVWSHWVGNICNQHYGSQDSHKCNRYNNLLFQEQIVEPTCM